ncbi:hypothetical protein ACFL2F_02925 [Myxococcota bacterium]
MRSLLICALLLPASLAQGIDRAEVLDRAQAYCYHPWTCTRLNLEAACVSGYDSLYTEGDHLGVPYDWGGYVSLHQFGVDIRAGQGAGTPPYGAVAACTTGVDCSGYVSKCWDTAHYTTSSIGNICTTINVSSLQPGDALNDPGNHIELYAGTLVDGTPFFYHAAPPNVHMNWYTGWPGVQGFDAIRYDQITAGGSDLGTMSNPILIDHWPFTDNRDTTQSQSDILDACGADWTKNESGPEYVYVFTTTVPGTLAATVSDGAGVDIDLHLYQDPAEHDCIARHDNTLDVPIGACGTYYLVLDTFVGGVEYPGPYTLNADFTPSGGVCSTKPEYDFLGGPGKSCAFPNHEDLSYCNPNLGVTTCIYTTGANPISFCSRSCQVDSDCTDDFTDGCCLDIDGQNNFYCMLESFCPTQQDGGTDAGTDAGVDAGEDAGADEGADEGWDAGGDDAGTGTDTSADTDTGADTDTRPDTGVDAGTDAGDYSRPDIEWPPPDDPEQGCGCGNGLSGSHWMFGVLLLLFLRRRFVS